jgi:hypothetical protein
MKKIFFCILLIICVNAISFAERKTWLSTGGTIGYYNINSEHLWNPGNTFLAGIHFNYYTIFQQRNIGIFSNFNFLFFDLNKESGYTDQIDFTIGIASAYEINKKLRTYFGIGPNVCLLINIYQGYDFRELSKLLLGLGIGGDIGLQFNFTNSISGNIGTILSFQFFGYGYYSAIPSPIYGWENGYLTFGIKPYIGVVIHL